MLIGKAVVEQRPRKSLPNLWKMNKVLTQKAGGSWVRPDGKCQKNPNFRARSIMKKPQIMVMLALLVGIQWASAQTFIPFYSFTNRYDSEGSVPTLVQASDGNFYGVSQYGGTDGTGSIFQITAGGTLTLLHSFAYTDGNDPVTPLMQANDGNLYGTTEYGGNGAGTVFRITAGGAFTLLYSFLGGTNGEYPVAGLVQATDGKLYGTCAGNNYRMVFGFTPPPSPPIVSPLTLNISFYGNISVLFGPPQSTNYILQSTTNLASPNWITICNPMTNGFTVTNSAPAQYFRLAAP